MTATHFIHIGRNKCASTTLQYFFMNNRDALAACGVDYFVFGLISQSFPDVPGFLHHLQWGAHIAANPSRSTLISSEDLMPYGAAFAAPQIEALNGAPRKVIAYIRDYTTWTRSDYAEAVMTGRSTLDYDAYLRKTFHSVSAMDTLSDWGECAGWENMHVRSLAPASLHRGDVLLDCAHVIGIDEAVVRRHRPDPRHISPHWIVTEIIRQVRAADTQADWRSFTHEVIYPLRPLIERAIAETGAQDLPGTYASAEQVAHLTDLFNHDAARLSARLNFPIPEAGVAQARVFLPSIDHVPTAVLQRLKDIAAEVYQDDTSPAYSALCSALR